MSKFFNFSNLIFEISKPFLTKVLGIMLISFVYSFSTQGQNFAPIGASWHYSHPDVFSPNIYFNKIQVIGDTIIDELKYSILEKSLTGCDSGLKIEYVREENGKIFYYSLASFNYHLLYDFNLIEGDTLKIIVPNVFNSFGSIDTLFFAIDSTRKLNINGVELKTQYVRYTKSSLDDYTYYGFDGKIIERLGHNENMFPWIYSVCDGPADTGLRCYEDNLIGHYETGIAESCIFTGLEQIQQNKIKIFPNPVQSNLVINFTQLPSKREDIFTRIFDITGKIVLQADFQQNIDVSNLQKGIYFLHLYDLEGKRLSCKFLKL